MNASLRIIVNELAAMRGERLLFNGLSFALGSGEAMLVTGPNGVGKSTLLRSIAGLTATHAGGVKLEGTAKDIALAQAAHFLGARDGLRGALTVRENLAFARDLLGGPGQSIDDAAAALELGRILDLPASVLSSGQRQRAALARLLVAERPIWLLDEPTSALDSASRTLVSDLISAHVAAGGIVIAATHLSLGIMAGSEIVFRPDGSHEVRGVAQ